MCHHQVLLQLIRVLICQIHYFFEFNFLINKKGNPTPESPFFSRHLKSVEYPLKRKWKFAFSVLILISFSETMSGLFFFKNISSSPSLVLSWKQFQCSIRKLNLFLDFKLFMIRLKLDFLNKRKKSFKWEFRFSLIPDYVMNNTTDAFFLRRQIYFQESNII